MTRSITPPYSPAEFGSFPVIPPETPSSFPCLTRHGNRAEMGVQNIRMEMAAEMAGKTTLEAQTRTYLPVYFWFTSGLLLGNA